MNPLAGDELTARTRQSVGCETMGVVRSGLEPLRTQPRSRGRTPWFRPRSNPAPGPAHGQKPQNRSAWAASANSLQIGHHRIVTAGMGRFGIQQRGERVGSILFVVEPAAQPVAGLGPQFIAAMEGQDDHIRRDGFDGGLLRQQGFAQQVEPPQPGAQSGLAPPRWRGQQVERMFRPQGRAEIFIEQQHLQHRLDRSLRPLRACPQRFLLP